MKKYIPYYLALILLSLLLIAFTPGEPTRNPEVINTLDDLAEFIAWDIEEGKLDSISGQTYLDNIKLIREELTN